MVDENDDGRVKAESENESRTEPEDEERGGEREREEKEEEKEEGKEEGKEGEGEGEGQGQEERGREEEDKVEYTGEEPNESSPLLHQSGYDVGERGEFGEDDEKGSERDESPLRDRSSWEKLRLVAYRNVEGTIDSPLEYAILLLIFINVVLLVVSTLVVDPGCFGARCLRLGDKYETFFEAAEAISVYIFTFEYILRLWACIENPNVKAKGPVVGRIRYALSFFPIVDVLSIAPYWGFMIVGEESPDFTTAIRVFRLVRLLKADKYLRAFSLLGKVLQENATLLIASSFYAVLIWVISSTLLHITEMDNPALGTHFQSIPQAMFPCVLMLTGEYPLADFTPIGQVRSPFQS